MAYTLMAYEVMAYLWEIHFEFILANGFWVVNRVDLWHEVALLLFRHVRNVQTVRSTIHHPTSHYHL